jgi:hypothetical protein
MKVIYCLICLLIFVTSHGQEFPYKFSQQIDSALQNDTVQWKYEIAAWDYSFIGEYATAINTFEQRNKGKIPTIPKVEVEKYTNKAKAILLPYKPIPAKQYIINQAKNTRLVIINEAHHNARHRNFVEGLLPDLSKLGYTFLGIETLQYRDTLLMQRKYPILISGIYSQEPSFGNMIRAAINENYTLFSYETQRGVGGKEREEDQAQNIKKLVDKYPNGKFIIYCGFQHVAEDSLQNGWLLAMAGRLKRLTGIDPLTVDQVELTENGERDNFLRKAVKLNYSAVFIDSSGNAFNKAVENAGYDVNVFHPDTKYINGRPEWLYGKNKAAVAITPKIRIDFPCLVFAYKKGEKIEEAVPVDIIELKSKEDNKKLVLPNKQQYLIVVKNRNGHQQTINL